MNVNNHDITINTKSNLLFLALTIIPFVEYLGIISLPLRGCAAVAAAAWAGGRREQRRCARHQRSFSFLLDQGCAENSSQTQVLVHGGT